MKAAFPTIPPSEALCLLAVALAGGFLFIRFLLFLLDRFADRELERERQAREKKGGS